MSAAAEKQRIIFLSEHTPVIATIGKAVSVASVVSLRRP
jgi:hypothetical protein